MKFLVLQKQKGYGCDYTIGCGMLYEIIEANSKEELLEEIFYPDGRENGCYKLEGDSELEEMYVVELDISACKIDLDTHKAIAADNEKEIERIEKELKEKAELLRLKEKYA